jgi:hypothetical protein
MRGFLLVLFFLALSTLCKSQVFYEQILNPTVEAGLTYAQKKPMTDSLGNYRNSGFQAGFTLPLYTRFSMHSKTGNPRLIHIFTGLRGGITLPEMTFVYPSHYLVNAGLGLSALFVDGKKNTWLANARISLSEDKYTLANPCIRTTGALVYKRKVSTGFSYHLGAVYTYAYGKDYLLPLLGLNFKISSHSLMMVNLPLSISLLYRPDNKSAVMVYLKPVGDLSSFSSEGMITDSLTKKNFQLRRSAIQLGATGKFNAGKHFIFTARTGFDFGKKLSFYENSVKLVETGVTSAGFLTFGVIFKFGKTKNKKDKDPLIDIEDIPEELLME